MDNQVFADRHVVVTGATGALGSAVTSALLACGATCHLPTRRPLEGEPFGAEAASRVVVRPGVDLTDETAVREYYAATPSLWASLHCAGGFAMAPVAETAAADLQRMWSLNVVSAFLCCREAARAMQAAGSGGRIVNVAARAGLEPRGGGGMVAYTASKSALVGLTEALAEELAPAGIWVNAVAPSIMDTAANRQAMPQADHAAWPTVDQVAETILFLASPANAVTRGGIVPVYGRS